jgi:hypothetical protein
MVNPDIVTERFVEDMKRQIRLGYWGSVQNLASEPLKPGSSLKAFFDIEQKKEGPSIKIKDTEGMSNLLFIIHDKFGDEKVQELIDHMIMGLRKTDHSNFRTYFERAIDKILGYEAMIGEVTKGDYPMLITSEHLQELEKLSKSRIQKPAGIQDFAKKMHDKITKHYTDRATSRMV